MSISDLLLSSDFTLNFISLGLTWICISLWIRCFLTFDIYEGHSLHIHPNLFIITSHFFLHKSMVIEVSECKQWKHMLLLSIKNLYMYRYWKQGGFLCRWAPRCKQNCSSKWLWYKECKVWIIDEPVRWLCYNIHGIMWSSEIRTLYKAYFRAPFEEYKSQKQTKKCFHVHSWVSTFRNDTEGPPILLLECHYNTIHITYWQKAKEREKEKRANHQITAK